MATLIDTVTIPFDPKIATTFNPHAFEFGYKRLCLLFPEGLIETARLRAPEHLKYLRQRIGDDQKMLTDLLFLAEWRTGCRPEYLASDGAQGIFGIQARVLKCLGLDTENELDYTEAGLRLWVTARRHYPRLECSMQAYNLFYAMLDYLSKYDEWKLE